MSAVNCAHCQLPCYPLEKMVLGERAYHRGCAKCSHCQSTLSLSSFSICNGSLYCKPHFMELFKATGGKYAFPSNSDAAVAKPVAMEEQEAPRPRPVSLRAVNKNLPKPAPSSTAAAAPVVAAQMVVLKSVPKPAEFTKREEPVPPPPSQPKRAAPETSSSSRLGQFLPQSTTNASTVSTSATQEPAEKKSRLAAFLAQTAAPAVVEPVVKTVAPAVVEPVVKPVAPVVAAPVVKIVAPVIVEPVVKPVAPVVATPVVKPVAVTPSPVPSTTTVMSSNNNNNATAALEAKLKEYEAKIALLNSEVDALRGRVSMLDGSKEYLVKENQRLEGLLNSLTSTTQHDANEMENGKPPAANAAAAASALELSWARAKKLLRAGKITQDQHDAACRAALEASRAFGHHV